MTKSCTSFLGLALMPTHNHLLYQERIVGMQVTKWPAMQKWSREHLRASFAECQVTVGDYEMQFKDFLQYLDLNIDDMPLYLFDKEFAAKAPQLADDFQVCLCSKSMACISDFQAIDCREDRIACQCGPRSGVYSSMG